MSLDRQEQRLIELVEQYRERECQSLLDKARAQVDGMIEEAHRNARERVHGTVESERARARERIRRAEAELNTRRRAHAQRAAARLLEEGRELLRERLAASWADRTTRHDWIQAALAEALRRLPPTPWRVQHPPQWDPADAEAVYQTLRPEIREQLSLETDADLSAGLRIRSGHAVLDVSLEGLLADRGMIESRLLALMERGDPE